MPIPYITTRIRPKFKYGSIIARRLFRVAVKQDRDSPLTIDIPDELEAVFAQALSIILVLTVVWNTILSAGV